MRTAVGSIRNGLEELAFRGIKLTFDLTHRFRILVRIDDDLVDTFEAMPVYDAMALIDDFVDR